MKGALTGEVGDDADNPAVGGESVSDETPRTDEQEDTSVPGRSEGDEQQAESGGAAQEVVESKHQEGESPTPGGG